MPQDVQFPKKKAPTPLSFFRNLDSGGKLVLLLSSFIFFSLLVCAGLLFWFKKREQGLEISLQDLVKDSVDVLTIGEVFEKDYLVQASSTSEDGCAQKSCIFEYMEEVSEGNLLKAGRERAYLEELCPEATSSTFLDNTGLSKGDQVLVDIEKCSGSYFSECYVLWRGTVTAFEDRSLKVSLERGKEVTFVLDSRLDVYTVSSFDDLDSDDSIDWRSIEFRQDQEILAVLDFSGRLKAIYVKEK